MGIRRAEGSTNYYKVSRSMRITSCVESLKSATISLEETAFLNPHSRSGAMTPCRVSVRRPRTGTTASGSEASQSGSGSGRKHQEYSLRGTYVASVPKLMLEPRLVDVLGSTDQRPYRLEVLDESLDKCIAAMMEDLQKRPPPLVRHRTREVRSYPDLTGGFIEVDALVEGGAYKDIIEGTAAPPCLSKLHV